MKNIVGYTLLALLLNSNTLWADDTEKESDPCSAVYDFATLVMDKRQAGVSLVTMMRVAPAGASTLKSIVMAAYDTPQFSGEEYRKKAAEEFANKWALKCYKERG